MKTFLFVVFLLLLGCTNGVEPDYLEVTCTWEADNLVCRDAGGKVVNR